MKKFGLVISVILNLLLAANASEVEQYCPKAPYNLSSGFKSFTTSVTGVNFLTKKIAEKGIANALKKELGTNFKVNIATFGGNNLLEGKFKKLTTSTKKIQNHGIWFSSVKTETLCGFNHIKYQDNKLYFVENMVARYEGKITQNDLKQTILSEEYTKAINKLSVNSNGIKLIQINNIDIRIENNRIIMEYDVTVPLILGSSTKHVSFSTGLDVENGKINFENIDFGNAKLNNTMKSALPIINKLNPLTYKIKTTPKHNAIVNVKTVKIINNEILIDGIIVIPKNYTQHNGDIS